jgi:hypothetical protein
VLGGVFSVSPLDAGSATRWALVWAAAAALAAGVALWSTNRGGVDTRPLLEFWLAAAMLSVPALVLASTAVLLRVPERARPAAQIALALAGAGLYVAILAWPAERLASLDELTADQWPLAPCLAVLVLAYGWFALPRGLPLRAFLVAAAVAFVLVVPDYSGLYIALTGETDYRFGFATPGSDWVQLSAEAAARQRASGVVLTWYLLLLAAAWMPLMLLLALRRRRQGKAL